MTRSQERRASPQLSNGATAVPTGSTTAPATSSIPPSPARSDKSTESEGRPVREKLKETRIDGQASSDQPMNDVASGAHDNTVGDQSTSGSESGRGRLRRKRSREDLEEGDEAQPIKKHERHVRKKSRDVTSPAPYDADAKVVKNTVSRIEENAAGEVMSTESLNGRPTSPAAGAKEQKDQAANAEEPAKDSQTTSSTSTTTAPSNASSSGKADPDKPKEDLPQTSDAAFKASGFGSFASASASPFSAVGSSGGISAFGGAGSNKLSSFASTKTPSTAAPSGFGRLGGGAPIASFASSAATSTPAPSGFGSLGGLPAPASGGSTFGGSLGQSAFGGLSGAKPAGISSFATPGAKAITGLSKKPARPFGAVGDKESEGEDSGDEASGDDSGDEDDQSSTQPTTAAKKLNLTLQEVETGEENEESVWTGRGKIYAFENKGWHERGSGTFKFNITKTGDPKKARFVMRADNTHRLLLNVAVTKDFKFGNAQGKAPSDGKLVFSVPVKENGKEGLETRVFKLKSGPACELWDQVERFKTEGL